MIYRDNSHHPMCNAVEHRWYMIVLFSLFDSLRSYHCTLPKWHSGDHIAEGLEKYPICHQWPQQKGRLLLPHETEIDLEAEHRARIAEFDSKLHGVDYEEEAMEMPKTRIVSRDYVRKEKQ
jgi:hypothetical protein